MRKSRGGCGKSRGAGPINSAKYPRCSALQSAEVNRKQKVSEQRKLNSLQDGYLGF